MRLGGATGTIKAGPRGQDRYKRSMQDQVVTKAMSELSSLHPDFISGPTDIQYS